MMPLTSDELDINYLNLSNKIDIGEQLNWGGYSDIWKGVYHTASRKVEVAVKMLRVRQSKVTGSLMPMEERLRKRFFREVLLWRTLRNPHVVPLLGFTMDPNSLPTLVSPWYIHGNIIQYIALRPRSDRLSLASDATEGLAYLHSIPVAHGDLKGENVLVDDNGRASLCDFGMSQFVDEASQITGFTTTSGNGGGTDRFMCPELLEDEPKTTATDMWACGCLVWLILTDEIPYGHIVRKHAIPFAIMRGDKPIAQRNDTVDASLWAFISECWNRDPNQRPTALDLGLHLKSLLGSRTLFHLQSLRHTQSLESPHRNIRSMRFSPDGRFLAVVAGDNNVSIWNFEMGSISSSYFRILNVEETAQAVFWSKSQYYLLVETSFSVQIWAIETGQRSARLQSATLATWLPDSVAFSYVTLSGIFVKDLSDSSTKNMSIDVGTQELLAVIFAPDNTRVLVLTAGATPQTSNSDKAVLTIHNQVTSKVERSITFPVIPSGISLSRDGRFILVAHYKEAPEVWEIRVKGVPASETVELSYLHKYQAESGTKNYHKVHFGGFRDQFVIAKLRDGPITIWDRDTAGILHSIPIPLINQPTGLTSMSNCAEADNLMLAVGVGGGSMQVWAASQQSNGSSAVVESSFQGIGAVQR